MCNANECSTNNIISKHLEQTHWPTGGQCDDWHFMSLTRRSTEGILDVVSEQTKVHTGISFLCFEVILICQCVPSLSWLC